MYLVTESGSRFVKVQSYKKKLAIKDIDGKIQKHQHETGIKQPLLQQAISKKEAKTYEKDKRELKILNQIQSERLKSSSTLLTTRDVHKYCIQAGRHIHYPKFRTAMLFVFRCSSWWPLGHNLLTVVRPRRTTNKVCKGLC